MPNNTRDNDKLRGTDDNQTIFYDEPDKPPELGGIGLQTITEADSLDCFTFETGEKLIEWDWWDDEPKNDKIWVVTGRKWEYRVSWVRDRDNVPTREHHRIYELTERETWAELERSEAELVKEAHWQALADVEVSDE